LNTAKAITFGDVLNANRGAGPGFDALRIFLSVAILLWHSVYIAHGRAYLSLAGQPIEPLVLALVPGFFCLSGFLVTGSAIRTRSVRTFLTFRSLRIFPALSVEVLLSALILGPLLTTLPLNEYFSSVKFFSYFGNIVGRIRYELPGVFENNPLPKTVNGSLWTLQPEFYCYLIMAGLMASKLVYNKKLYTIIFMLMSLVLIFLDFTLGIGKPSPLVPWPAVIYSFFVGIAYFHWKSEIPKNRWLAIVSALISYGCLSTPGLTYAAIIALCYLVVYLGMLKVPRIPLLQRGDYSYGIYLFGYPIQQTIAQLFPSLRQWELLFVAATLTSALFAAASWHWIEKPILRFKTYFLKKNTGHEAAAKPPTNVVR